MRHHQQLPSSLPRWLTLRCFQLHDSIALTCNNTYTNSVSLSSRSNRSISATDQYKETENESEKQQYRRTKPENVASQQVFSGDKWKLEIILPYFSKFSPKSSIRTRRSNDSPKEGTFDDILNYFSPASSTKALARKIVPRDSQLLLAHAFQASLSLHHDKKHFHDNAEKVGSSTLSQICNGLISAFENIRKLDQNLEITPFQKEALFTAATIVAQL